jgi:hypothetical protein
MGNAELPPAIIEETLDKSIQQVAKVPPLESQNIPQVAKEFSENIKGSSLSDTTIDKASSSVESQLSSATLSHKKETAPPLNLLIPHHFPDKTLASVEDIINTFNSLIDGVIDGMPGEQPPSSITGKCYR